MIADNYLRGWTISDRFAGELEPNLLSQSPLLVFPDLISSSLMSLSLCKNQEELTQKDLDQFCDSPLRGNGTYGTLTSCGPHRRSVSLGDLRLQDELVHPWNQLQRLRSNYFGSSSHVAGKGCLPLQMEVLFSSASNSTKDDRQKGRRFANSRKGSRRRLSSSNFILYP